MKYDFDKIVDRRGDSSYKWGLLKHFFGTEDIISMTIAEMDLPVPPQVTLAMKKRLEYPIYGYTLKPESFFIAIQRWLYKNHLWEIKNDWITTTPGVVSAINFAIQSFTEKGENVLIQPPVYAPFFESIIANERKILTNNLIPKQISKNKIVYEIDFIDFEEKIKQAKLFILCSPQNPVSKVWSRDDLKKIGGLCKKYEVIVFADEVHNDIVYPGYKHNIFANINDFKDFSLTSISPSKTFNVAGVYSSVIIIPNKEIKTKFENTMAKLGLTTSIGNVNIPPFAATILESCFTECDDWYDELMSYLCQNKNFLTDFIEQEIPILKISEIESTFMAWIDFNELGFSHPELIKFLVEKAKLGLDTGEKYGGKSTGYMRLNFGCSRVTLEKAINQLKSEIMKLKYF